MRSVRPKSKTKFVFALLLLAASAACEAQSRPSGARLPLERIKMPAGFSIAVFSDQVPGARSMARSPKGILYVGTRGEGKVYALVDRNGDGRADEVHTIASGLNTPNGVAWKDGALYVAEISRILRFDGIDGRLKNPPKPAVVTSAYPKDGHHGWKFIRFGPDGKLYVPVGAPCNICDPENPIYSTITRISPRGGKPEIFARGIRNTVGFDWHPSTMLLWFTENGRDWAGDDSPPDELDHAPRAGLHFGFPYCNANTPDKEFGKNRPCSQFVPPAINLGPHVAALGMRFYTGTMFPEPYRGQIFIAEHGSWNRSKPIGYRVMMVRLQGNKAVSYEPFAEGWLAGGNLAGGNSESAAWGRPVDVEVLPDGSMLVSDDKAGAVYRVTYTKK